MLYYVCLLALLTTQVLSMPRYVIELFESEYPYAFPIDVCVVTGVIKGVKNIKYSCSGDGLTVTRSTYSSNKCTGNATSKAIITAANETSTGLYQFNCNGTNDYMQTQLYLNCATTSPTATIYAVTNLCIYSSNITNSTFDVYTQTNCNSTGALIKTYYSTGLCDIDAGDMTKNKTLVSTSCSFYAKSGSFSVNAKLADCIYNGYTQFPEVNATATQSGTVTQLVNLSLSLTAPASATVDPDICGVDWFTFISSIFGNSYVKVTRTCQSNEGYGYAGIDIDVYVEVNSDSELQETTASAYVDDIKTSISATYGTTIDVTGTGSVQTPTTSAPTTTKTGSFASTNKLNNFVCFVIFGIIVSMYTL